MVPQDFHRRLAKGLPGPAYFFSGPESRIKQRALEALMTLIPEGIRPFNVNIYHGNETDLAEVVAAARTVPFMAPRRLVILRDLEKLRRTERRSDLLEEYLRAPVLETVLVMTTEETDAAKTLKKRYGEWWVDVEFAPLRGRQMAEEIEWEVARLGCRIAPEAVGPLLDATGADLGRVQRELEKLRSAVGEGGLIGEREILRHVAGYGYQNHFDLLNAISARDLEGSVRLLSRVLVREDEVQGLMGLIGKRLRVLWFFAAGVPEIPAVFKVYPSQKALLRRDAGRFTRQELERGLADLLRIDLAIKTTTASPRLLLEHFLLGLLGIGEQGSGGNMNRHIALRIPDP